MMKESVQKFENKETFDFDEFLNNNQLKDMQILERYLKDVYRELSDNIEGINRDTFREFINLPSYIADKTFNVINKLNKPNIGLNDFLNGITCLYNGEFLQLTNFIFEFYDFDRDGKIIYEDVKQIQYLILPSQHHNEEVFECINDSLDSFFEDYKFMDYDNFVYVTENFNSDIFMNLIIYFYINKPFSNEIINYYLTDKRLANDLNMKINKPGGKFTLKKTHTENDLDKRNSFSISTQYDPLLFLNSQNISSEINLKNPQKTKGYNFGENVRNLITKNIIKTPKNNLYLKRISENYCRMVTYTEPQHYEDVQNIIQEESLNSYDEEDDIDYDNVEDPAEENEGEFKIYLPIMPSIRNLFAIYSTKSELTFSTNFEKMDENLDKKRFHTEDEILQKNFTLKNQIDDISKGSDNISNENTQITQDNKKLSIIPLKRTATRNSKKKIISKFYRSYTFNYDKSDISNKTEENKENNLSNDCFIADETFILKQAPKVTYENFINKYDPKKDKIIKYYIVLNNKMMLYFKNDSKSQYRGLHYLSDNYSLVVYDKTKTLISNGIKYYYLNLNIKDSKKYFISKNEFEMRKWVEVLKKTINPHKSRLLKDYYTLKETICEGKYGIVKRGMNRKTKQEVSIKIINRKNFNEAKKYELIYKEIEILRHCNHRSILKYIDYFEELNPELNKNYIYIVMEYLSGGDLATYIHKNGALHESKVISITWDISKGLEYLHKLGIVHRDIKPENIVFDHMQKPRIVDFGLSQIISNNEFLTESYGTYLYASPEIHSKRKYNKLTDIWSFGVLVFFILTGDLPFEKNKDSAHLIICDRDHEFEFDNINFLNASTKLQNFIRGCLKKNVDERFNIEQIIKHEVFQKYNKP